MKIMKPGQKWTWEFLTKNVLFIHMDDPVWINNTQSIDGQKFHYFRDGKADGKTVYCFIARSPSELTSEDMLAINSLCDIKEGARNRKVKERIAGALARHFNGRAFHVFEPGCGRYPLTPWFPAGTDVSYKGIESDPSCVEVLAKKGIAASSWQKAMKEGVPQGRPSVCAAVYALHFMVGPELPEAIRRLTGKDGFFVGNYYAHPHEKRTRKDRRKLSRILKEAGLFSAVRQVGADSRNEYWVIGANRRVVKEFSRKL